MKTDVELQDDVVQELRWDPQVAEPDHIGLAVADRAVTLTGHTTTYAEKLAAARAAERVYGVKAVANDLQVRLAGSPRDDADIAKAIAHVLEWNVQIPNGRVQAPRCKTGGRPGGSGRPRLQRHEIERMVRHVRGVVGITDTLSLTPPVSPVQMDAQIQEALQREAEVDARQVRVEVADHTARLYGQVHSLREADAARAAAAAAPGGRAGRKLPDSPSLKCSGRLPRHCRQAADLGPCVAMSWLIERSVPASGATGVVARRYSALSAGARCPVILPLESRPSLELYRCEQASVPYRRLGCGFEI